MTLTFEYYFYNRETDRYTYDLDFKKMYELFHKTDSFEKTLGVSVIDEDGCTMSSDTLLEYKDLTR